MRLTTRSVSEQSILVLEGLLDAAHAPQLRRMLADRVAADPHPVVIVDLSRVRAADPAVLSVLAAHQTDDDGPGPVIVLTGARGAVAQVLEDMGLPGVVPVTRTVADAVALAAARPPRLCAVRSLRGHPSAPRLARQFASETCSQWRLVTEAEDVELVVGELVTNAVTHAKTDLIVRLERSPDRLMVAVRDAAVDSFPSWWRGEDETAPTREGEPGPSWGHGLTIVRALAETAGVHADRAGGKVVWAELRLGGRSGTPSPGPRLRRVHLTVNSGRSAQPDVAGWVVRLELAWIPDSPEMVLVSLASRPRHPSVPQGRWRVARSTLRDGLRGPVRDGAVRLWPERDGRELVLEVPASPPHVVRVSAARVRGFLDSTEVPAAG
jgi:anti-anti-sigma regulatory factor/anti-sigma regulatory factor (Ser/Thr protein kinase)